MRDGCVLLLGGFLAALGILFLAWTDRPDPVERETPYTVGCWWGSLCNWRDWDDR